MCWQSKFRARPMNVCKCCFLLLSLVIALTAAQSTDQPNNARSQLMQTNLNLADAFSGQAKLKAFLNSIPLTRHDVTAIETEHNMWHWNIRRLAKANLLNLRTQEDVDSYVQRTQEILKLYSDYEHEHHLLNYQIRRLVNATNVLLTTQYNNKPPKDATHIYPHLMEIVRDGDIAQKHRAVAILSADVNERLIQFVVDAPRNNATNPKISELLEHVQKLSKGVSSVLTALKRLTHNIEPTPSPYDAEVDKLNEQINIIAQQIQELEKESSALGILD